MRGESGIIHGHTSRVEAGRAGGGERLPDSTVEGPGIVIDTLPLSKGVESYIQSIEFNFTYELLFKKSFSSVRPKHMWQGLQEYRHCSLYQYKVTAHKINSSKSIIISGMSSTRLLYTVIHSIFSSYLSDPLTRMLFTKSPS